MRRMWILAALIIGVPLGSACGPGDDAITDAVAFTESLCAGDFEAALARASSGLRAGMTAEEFGATMLERVPCDGRTRDWEGSAKIRDDFTSVTVELVLEDGTDVQGVVDVVEGAAGRRVVGYRGARELTRSSLRLTPRVDEPRAPDRGTARTPVPAGTRRCADMAARDWVEDPMATFSARIAALQPLSRTPAGS